MFITDLAYLKSPWPMFSSALSTQLGWRPITYGTTDHTFFFLFFCRDCVHDKITIASFPIFLIQIKEISIPFLIGASWIKWHKLGRVWGIERREDKAFLNTLEMSNRIIGSDSKVMGAGSCTSTTYCNCKYLTNILLERLYLVLRSEKPISPPPDIMCFRPTTPRVVHSPGSGILCR